MAVDVISVVIVTVSVNIAVTVTIVIVVTVIRNIVVDLYDCTALSVDQVLRALTFKCWGCAMFASADVCIDGVIALASTYLSYTFCLPRERAHFVLQK